MIITYIAGLLTPFALYGLYKAFLIFTLPNDIESVISRLDQEQERIIQEGAKRTLEYRN